MHIDLERNSAQQIPELSSLLRFPRAPIDHLACPKVFLHTKKRFGNRRVRHFVTRGTYRKTFKLFAESVLRLQYQRHGKRLTCTSWSRYQMQSLPRADSRHLIPVTEIARLSAASSQDVLTLDLCYVQEILAYRLPIDPFAGPIPLQVMRPDINVNRLRVLGCPFRIREQKREFVKMTSCKLRLVGRTFDTEVVD